MNKPFSDIAAFPVAAKRDGIGGNNPPLDERIIMDFNEALSREGIAQRLHDLIQRGMQAGTCNTAEAAGRYADFVRMAAAEAKALESERDKLNRPLLNAQRALKGRQDALLTPLNNEVKKIRGFIDTYRAEEARKERERQAIAAEEARKAREAAEQAGREAEEAGRPVEIAPVVEVKAAPVEAAPEIRGDYGAKVGTRTEWRHEIDSVRKLPDSILKHDKVISALNQVIGQQVRSGTRKIKGVMIYPVEATVIR